MTKPVPCHFCNRLIAQGIEGRWHATHPSDPAPWTCYSEHGHRPDVPADPLDESQRFQTRDARLLLATWDRERGGEGIYGTERALADAVRNLLAILDQLAPSLSGTGEAEEG